ncbi:MerR family transcriptional regulator [Streptomyces sp. SID8499]|uniref:DNA polymerase III subunit beta family protein n=1 Tax=Streptomyces sp. SID8499 TaxID=2706106 RepID=UPI0031BB0D63
MENDMYSIGEPARESGLSVSALRFYDRAGVLVPARVDPVSGYRWYGAGQRAEAAVLARLRRAGMPLADIRLVLAGWSGADPDLVRGLLQAHLRRLERGLSDAREEFSALRARLDRRENPMPALPATPVHLALPAPELAAALDAVRFAAGTDPELPMLGGVLLDIEDDALRVVATDRYRMAIARTRTTTHDGPHTQIIVPLPVTDAIRALLDGEETAQLVVEGDGLTLETGDRRTTGRCLDHDFPDYRRLLDLPTGRRARIDTAAFRTALETGPVHASEPRQQDGAPRDLSVLRVTADGTVTVCGDGDDTSDAVAFDRDYLLHALTAAARPALILEFGTPATPLAVRRPDDEDTFSILMPVRLEN